MKVAMSSWHREDDNQGFLCYFAYVTVIFQCKANTIIDVFFLLVCLITVLCVCVHV